MPNKPNLTKKTKSTDDRLEGIEILLAAQLLGRKPNILKVSKIIGMSPAKLIQMLGKETRSPRKKPPKK